MSNKPNILYRYTGNGEAYRSVPARDLTQADYDRLGLIEKTAVIRGDLYRKVEPPKTRSETRNDEKEGGDS